MPRRNNSQSGEERLIDRYFRPIAKSAGALGLVDDAAMIRPRRSRDLVLTVDAIVAGTHFLPDDPPGLVARKALRVNLSDLAAKGAEPLGALLALSLPQNVGEEWLAAFARGLGEDCERFRCPLLGGDTTGTGGLLTISLTALGELPKGKMVRRKGARPGDVVVVTGTIGDAALGLLLQRDGRRPAFSGLAGPARDRLIARYRLPEPRLALARALRSHASSAIDISDGLAGDLGKLAGASGVGLRIEALRVPLSAPARAAIAEEPELLERALSGGDDFEVAATVPARRLKAFQRAAAKAEVEVTVIGRVERGEGVRFAGPDGRPMRFERPSFSHF